MRLLPRGESSGSRPPPGLRWRSNKYYLVMVTGVALFTDVSLFPIYSPAIPPRLEALGYSEVSSKAGWLNAAYAAGLILSTFPFTWLGM